MPTKAEQKRSAQAFAAFNNFYSSIWGEERWSQRLCPALLHATRHAVLVNTFAGDDKVETDANLTPMPLVPCLQVEPEKFVPPRKTNSGLLSHYNLDAASILAAELLDVHRGHHVLDLCAAPGGKSVAIAQYHPATLHSNEFDVARNKRLTSNLQSYLPSGFNLKVLKLDGTNKSASFPLREYDRVLVDAPCSSERHILHKYAANRTAVEMANWKASHTKTLAKTQVALLLTALRMVKAGGKIVYATCSLSTEENDGVIQRCKSKVEFETIEDDALDVMSEKTEYGRIVLPDHEQGGKWGPLYICVIMKPLR